MQFVKHPLIRNQTIEMRDYQGAILSTALEKNTLCVIGTGLGKTLIAIMLAAKRLEKYPDSKILIVAPTRPLCEQHQKSFRECLDYPEDEIVLITGMTPPREREKIYREAAVIAATPQCIHHDLISKRLSLRDFSCLIVDEVHRAVRKYAYPFVSRLYMEQSRFPRILGLTASPGSSEDKIKEICRNLSIEAVEIRTEDDADVSEYVEEKEIETIKVELTPEMKKMQENLKGLLRDDMDKLKNRYKIHARGKGDLINAQKSAQRKLDGGKNPQYFPIISLLAETVKVWYMLELLETQSISALKAYLDKFSTSKTKAAKRMLADRRISEVMTTVQTMRAEGREHPKLLKLAEIISGEIKSNPNIKIIIFSHYRNNIERIVKTLRAVHGCSPAILIGQAKGGLTQKQQIEVIRDFEDDVYNCLIGSSISEEGLHIPSADMAIFYEPVPSEIRTIQRKGRVGRTKVGRIVFLVTKGTRDETYYHVARRKEQRMREILDDVQSKLGERKQRTLTNF